MKRALYLFTFLFSVFFFSQSKYTVEQVEKSTDAQVIANFVKYNPNHPKTPEFKRKLFAIINNDKSPKQQSAVAKPTVAPISTKKLENEIKRDVAKDGTNDRHKRTADLLNHLFNSDPSSKTAYVQIVNKSKCNLIVKISGRRFYNLDVPANNQNFLLLDKGSYNITTSVCDAKYSSTKNITKDVVITLNAPK
ncbi:hypothetical protein MTP09_11715 [Chryseobacterium suipulveris]|uniref:DUF6759 domain-containing protein n=1 Tax=Chryseobacterium suipulveris TaxID=2929800 RepID=A0ABY4BMZ9_9FLAO|nr:DUF6759 domain-containing protein [Chryseobacterium suipulveris]UOE40566.1 hypothetical protein MTP09_11715 [Chryseobacterium suipulveris]